MSAQASPSSAAGPSGKAPSIALLIPCYSEAAHIRDVVERCRATGFDTIVVDDGSPDDTAAVARAAGAHVIVHEVNQGKGGAMNTGFRHVLAQGDRYDAVVVLDGDGQHLPEEIPAFAEKFAETRAAAIVGNRMDDTGKMPLVRRLTNRFMSGLLSREMGQRIPDTQCGFRLFRRDVLPLLLEHGKFAGFAADSEALLLISLEGHEIPSVRVSTVYGDERSKIHTVRDTIRFFRLLRHFRRVRRTHEKAKHHA